MHPKATLLALRGYRMYEYTGAAIVRDMCRLRIMQPGGKVMINMHDPDPQDWTVDIVTAEHRHYMPVEWNTVPDQIYSHLSNALIEQLHEGKISSTQKLNRIKW